MDSENISHSYWQCLLVSWRLQRRI